MKRAVARWKGVAGAGLGDGVRPGGSSRVIRQGYGFCALLRQPQETRTGINRTDPANSRVVCVVKQYIYIYLYKQKYL